MSPPLGQGPRESPEQYRARKALDKLEQHRRLRIAIASRLVADGDYFNLTMEPLPTDEENVRALHRRALRIADLLIEEAGK